MLATQLLLGSFALGLVGALTTGPEAKLVPINPRQSTNCNTAANRQCWSNGDIGGFNISTDSETSWPGKGRNPPDEKHYNIVISEKELSPFGTPKKMLVVNGTYPGPTLIANWGDRMTINVTNNMTDNGTSIHWHGVVQMNSNTEDGVNGITECPIPPGGSRVYSFIATQHGTTWYHSHTSAQYGDGVLGTMIINGPAILNYEEDLGTLPLSDYFANSMWEENQKLLPASALPPTAPGATFNGTMKNSSTNTGYYFNRTLKSNTTYRLRLINTAVDNGFAVSLDHHKMNVIAADFVPIKNYTTDWLLINIGQRYDVVFTTDQGDGNYWFRAVVPGGCGLNTLSTDRILAIFNYGNVTLAEPTNKTAPTTAPTVCNDEKNLIPYTKKSVPEKFFKFVPDKTDQLNVSLTKVSASPSSSQTGLVNSWIINNQAIDVAWEKPTLEYVAEKNTDNLAAQLNVYRITNKNEFYFWVIQSQFPAAHPIHLHGHDFYLLGQTNGTNMETFTGSDADKAKLNFENPPRRDVAMLPANGWMVIAFQADNPGAWLLHCHIAFHISGGLGIQFLEREQEIINLGKINKTCTQFNNYYQNAPFKKTDSGLRL